jgi:N-acetylneuraminic acid mutarotase
VSIGSLLRLANERRRSVPVGVQLLTGFAIGSIALVTLALFGPELPGPNVTELVTGSQERFSGPCDPRQGEVREPDQPVQTRERWRKEQPMPVARDELRAAAAGGRIFILNGQEITGEDKATSISEVQVFDPATETYSSAPDTPVPVDHSAVVVYRGDLYLVGGDSNGAPSSGLWRYSPDGGKWETLAQMDTPRAGHAAAVIGDRLYVVGGTTDAPFSDENQPPLTSLEIFDFQTGEWSRGPDMPTGRHHFGAAALDGRLYAVGGRAPGNFALETVERFEPERGEWERLAPLPLGTGGPSVVTAGGKIVVVGGGDDIEDWVTPATWALWPKQERWRRLADLQVPRHGHASAALRDRIYVFGGAPCADYGRTPNVESLSAARFKGG